jgi:hypothetical protein
MSDDRHPKFNLDEENFDPDPFGHPGRGSSRFNPILGD